MEQTNVMSLWNPEELAFADDIVATTGWERWWRWGLGGCLVAIVILGGVLIGWQVAQVSHYQRVIQQNALLIAQQSSRETACFQQAQTADQRDACAQVANVAAAALQRHFGAVPIPLSQSATASEMQNAFNALAAASCYDADQHGADADCLSGISSRLRIAVLDARDAAQN